jgi:hypothetical protein
VDFLVVHRKGLEPPTLGTGKPSKVAICNEFSDLDIQLTSKGCF